MKRRIIYMGTPEFAVSPLVSLLEHPDFCVVAVICQPDRPKGRRMKKQAPPVKRTAQNYKIPVFQPESVRTGEFEQQLRSLEPDCIVTAAYGRILPPHVLAVPPKGCINIHASLLPAYRGAAPIHWCLIRGEKETGITFMLMDEGMDTGPVLDQKKILISQEMDAEMLSCRLSQLAADHVNEMLEKWFSGAIQPVPQDPDKASVAPMLKKEMGQIDWKQSAQSIHNLVRGLYPWPGAYTWCGQKRMKIHRSRVCTDSLILESTENMEPGTICHCSGDAIRVACGTGVLDLLEIQSASGKRLHCRDCAHNYHLGQKMERDPS
jgi:methionyl-tRNA formyltransferase